MDSLISFKFKNEKKFDSIKIVGDSISLQDLRQKIQDKRNLSLTEKYELIITDNQTNEQYTKDEQRIQALSSLTIERAPLQAQELLPHLMNNYNNQRNYLISKPPYVPQQQFNQRYTPGYGQSNNNYNNGNTGYNNGGYQRNNNYGNQNFNINQDGPDENPVYLKRQNLDPSEINKLLTPQTQYFMIKCGNYENIKISQRHDVWATTRGFKEQKLRQALSQTQNVILIFSVNKSSQFQGFSKIKSMMSKTQGVFQVPEGVNLGGCFDIQWLRTTNVSFANIQHMKNPLNQDEPIKKSRDCQKLPHEIGLEICNMFTLPEEYVEEEDIVHDQQQQQMPQQQQSQQFNSGRPPYPLNIQQPQSYQMMRTGYQFNTANNNSQIMLQQPMQPHVAQITTQITAQEQTDKVSVEEKELDDFAKEFDDSDDDDDDEDEEKKDTPSKPELTTTNIKQDTTVTPDLKQKKPMVPKQAKQQFQGQPQYNQAYMQNMYQQQLLLWQRQQQQMYEDNLELQKQLQSEKKHSAGEKKKHRTHRSKRDRSRSNSSHGKSRRHDRRRSRDRHRRDRSRETRRHRDRRH